MPRFGGTVSTGRYPAYTIAASNSPEHLKNTADYICDGVNDEVEIQAAIDAVGNERGPIVCLLPGNFNIYNSINYGSQTTNVTKQGLILEGSSAFSPNSIASANPSHLVWRGANGGTLLNLGLLDGCRIENLRLTCDPAITGTIGIKWKIINDENANGNYLRNINITHFDLYGMQIGDQTVDGFISNVNDLFCENIHITSCGGNNGAGNGAGLYLDSAGPALDMFFDRLYIANTTSGGYCINSVRAGRVEISNFFFQISNNQVGVSSAGGGSLRFIHGWVEGGQNLVGFFESTATAGNHSFINCDVHPKAADNISVRSRAATGNYFFGNYFDGNVQISTDAPTFAAGNGFAAGYGFTGTTSWLTNLGSFEGAGAAAVWQSNLIRGATSFSARTTNSADVVETSGSTNQVIRDIIQKGSIVDNSSTGVFRINTTAGEIGVYSCHVKGLISAVLTSANGAAKTFEAAFAHVVRSSDDGGTTSAVAEIAEGASADVPNAGSINIDAVTMTVTDDSGLQQTVNFTIDVSGTASGNTNNVTLIVELVWRGYTTAPIITQL